MERYINYKFFLFKLYPMRKFLLFVSFIVFSVSVFAQVPTITSFSPASAEVGASVTITVQILMQPRQTTLYILEV